MANGYFTPEQLREITSIGGLQGQQNLLEQQLQQAIALRNRQQPQAYGWLGGLTSGLSDVVNTARSISEENRMRKQLQENLGKIGEQRSRFGELFYDRRPQMPEQQALADVLAGPPAAQNIPPTSLPPSLPQAAASALPEIPPAAGQSGLVPILIGGRRRMVPPSRYQSLIAGGAEESPFDVATQGAPEQAMQEQAALSSVLRGPGAELSPQMSSQIPSQIPQSIPPQMSPQMSPQMPLEDFDRRENVGMLGLLSGDPVLAQFGRVAVESAERERGRLAANQLKLLGTRKEDEGKAREEAFKRAEGLRKEFMATQGFKDAQIIADARGKIQQATSGTPSGASDISLLFGYMKLLDPNSVVRESEFNTGRNAGSLPDTLVTYWKKAVNGEILPSKVRSDIVKEGEKIYQNQLKRLSPLQKEFKRLASESGLKPEDVVLSLGLEPTPEIKTVKTEEKVDVRTRIRQLKSQGLNMKEAKEQLVMEGY